MIGFVVLCFCSVIFVYAFFSSRLTKFLSDFVLLSNFGDLLSLMYIVYMNVFFLVLFGFSMMFNCGLGLNVVCLCVMKLCIVICMSVFGMYLCVL